MTRNPFTPQSLYDLASNTLIVRCKTKLYPKKEGAPGSEWPDGSLSAGHEVRIFTICKQAESAVLAYGTCRTDAGCLGYSIADFKLLHGTSSIMRFMEQQVYEFGQVPFWLDATDCVAVKQVKDNVLPASAHTPSLLLSYLDFQRRCLQESRLAKLAHEVGDSDAWAQYLSRLLGFREKRSRLAAQSGTFI